MTTKDNKNKASKQMLIRYGRLGYLGWFSHEQMEMPHTPTKVIIKTERGLEMGELVGEHCYRGGNLKVNCTDLEEYYEHKAGEYPIGDGGEFVRFATVEDLSEERHIKESAKREMETCVRFARELDLDMKVVDYEHIFGGERVIFYFISEGRIDFRELVKMLAKEFQTRIEMRQIGARDEARLISDIETCGQQCCCARYLKILKPVNMRMAKVQKATLDPSKISGHCGRLRCCLRYEDDTYKELKSRLPNRSTRVRTANGEGRVVDYQILTQLLQIQYEDGKIEAVPLEECEILTEGKGSRGGNEEWGQREPRSAKTGTAQRDKACGSDSVCTSCHMAQSSQQGSDDQLSTETPGGLDDVSEPLCSETAEVRADRAGQDQPQDRSAAVQPESIDAEGDSYDEGQADGADSAGDDNSAVSDGSRPQGQGARKKNRRRRKPRPDRPQNQDAPQDQRANSQMQSDSSASAGGAGSQNAGSMQARDNRNRNKNRRSKFRNKNRRPNSESADGSRGQSGGSEPRGPQQSQE